MHMLRKCLSLFAAFFKIGLFTFGGGYAMLSMILSELCERRGWITEAELMDVAAVAESTPGPIAVNSATYIGYKQAGFFGALAATLGVVLPSFAVILAIAAALKQFRSNRYVGAALSGVHPAVAGMILATGVCVALECMWPKAGFDVRSAVIFALLLGITVLWKRVVHKDFSPILLILLSAALGVVLFGA